MKKGEGLRRRDKDFCENVVIRGMTKTEAYRVSGFKRSHKPGKTDTQNAWKLSTLPVIRAYMDELRAKSELTLDEMKDAYKKLILGEELKDSDRLTAMRDYSKLRGWTNDAGSHASDSRLLDVLSDAVKAIPKPPERSQMIDVTPRWDVVDVDS